MADEPRNAELETAILDNIDDAEAWQVYGDWLQTQGDPRGQLIALQIAASEPGAAAELEQQLDAQLQQHRETWLGPVLSAALEADDEERLMRLEWHGGFIQRARVGAGYDWSGPPVNEVVVALLESSAARFLRGLKLGLIDGEGGDDFGDVLALLSGKGDLRGLRELLIGEFEYPDETEISWVTVGDISGLYPRMPRLQSLHLRGGGIELGKLEHAALEQLTLETGGLPAGAVRSVAAAKLPRLEKLVVYFGDDNYGAEGDIEMLGPLFGGEGYPSLEYLGLVNSQFADDIARSVCDAEILGRLHTLDLSLGTLTDTGAQALLDNADKLQHLKLIDLSENFIGDELQSALTAAFGERVKLDEQDAPDDWGDGELHYYVSVSE